MGLIACLVIDGFLVSVERTLVPALRGRPVAVGGRTLVAVSPEARAEGVDAGMGEAEARRRCPSLVVVSGNVEAHRRVVARIDRLAHSAGCRREWRGLEELYLVAGADRGGERRVRRAAEGLLVALTDELELDVSCGIASTRVAARAAARLGAPRGLVQVLPGYDARFLAPLDIEWLEGIGPADAARLRAAGVATIGALASSSALMAQAALGRSARVMTDLAAARDGRTVIDVEPGQGDRPSGMRPTIAAAGGRTRVATPLGLARTAR